MFKLIQYIFFVAFSNLANGASAPWVGNDLSGIACDGGAQGYGPYDYTKRSTLQTELTLVESAHFTPAVENLIKGNSSGANPDGDIRYTLKAWPNHPRALLTSIRLQLNIKNKLTKFTQNIPPECYLQRAIRFSPNDTAIYTLYGYYLHKLGKLEVSSKYYEKSLSLNPDDSKAAYSYSLLLIDMKRLDDALKYAKIAYTQLNTPKSLKQKLIKLGAWRD